ncbi:hypothetical protein [Prevotella sp. kh1p2]|uniref:hypothetical protein n=1 Tax=Prevotella sp. kh1p2 TaxID=1761883 RepID=UPI0015A508E5|nr:hypothetical protein [Prevotella sp. kh1p2]
MAIAFRGQFYFAAEGHSYFARKGQRRLPSGVKRARLFQHQKIAKLFDENFWVTQ